MAALEITNNYLAEVIAGDLLVVRSEITEVKDKTIRFRHTMFDAVSDKPVATMQAVGVHMDRKIRKSCPFPADVKKTAKSFFQSPSPERTYGSKEDPARFNRQCAAKWKTYYPSPHKKTRRDHRRVF